MTFNYNNYFSVCITCCDRDVHFLDYAFRTIALQTVPFHELIISANGLPKNYFDKQPKYIRVAGKEIPINYYVYPKRKNPGFARNFGARFCETEYIMFCDIDDISLKFRLEYAQECIKKHQPDCFIHSQIWHVDPIEFVEGEVALQEVTRKKDHQEKSAIIKEAFENVESFMHKQKKPAARFEPVSKVTSIKFSERNIGDVYVRHKGKLTVAYGHPIVKVETLMNIKYDETLKTGEDLLFLYDLFKNGKNIIYSSDVLLLHRGISHSTANYEIRRLQGAWEVEDDFRKQYLENRLDKNLKVYHSPYYDKQDEQKPINPK